MTVNGLRDRAHDFLLSLAVRLAIPVMKRIANMRNHAPRARAVLDSNGLAIVPHQYYEPVVLPGDLRHDLAQPRMINGLDMNEGGQLALLEHFRFRDELLAIPKEPAGAGRFGYDNGTFGYGDSETLFNMIRHFRPRRIVEIGSGNSTLMARLAIDRNRAEDASYSCEHICIEPYEMPWLEDLGIRVVRQRVETMSTDVFCSLEANDILFIDSTHIIRTQGDVLHEYLCILGLLKVGVIVHAHDIFTPHDYLKEWVVDMRLLWNEQYLLEAFLAFNREFEVLEAVNWLNRNHRDKLGDACPILMQQPDRQHGSFWFPSSFWFRRVTPFQVNEQLRRPVRDHTSGTERC
jgi:hypothetical protein